MTTKKEIKIGMFLLAWILLIPLGSATYTSSSVVQYTQPGTGFFSEGYWQSDSSMCEAGQDFVIQIAPFGCEPAVVRSDLLEEQNYPVFCQLAATKINPLIDVEAIESMSFSGEYPEEVSGIGFYPAKAALGEKGNLNSPVLNNIGYAVIVLKEQPNASAIPDFVQGNLTAKIKYDIKNAYGIGEASFYLPEMSDDYWENNHAQYGFWEGRFYLRAEAVDKEGAAVSVYDDTRKLSNINLKKGETSKVIYLPGFDCLAGLELKLDGLEDPNTRARLDINGEIIEVAENEKFLENRCWINDIIKNGLDQAVTIRCNEDENTGLFGGKSFELKIKPKLKITVAGDENKKGDCVKSEEGCEIGDVLYKLDEQGEKFIYLGYIGEDSEGIQFIVPVVSTERTKEDFLKSTFYNTTLTTMVRSYIYSTKNILIDTIKAAEASIYGTISIVGNKWVSGSYPLEIINLEGKENLNPSLKTSRSTFNEISVKVAKLVGADFNIPKIKFGGFTGAKANEIPDDNKEYYQNAMENYDEIIESFSSENYEDITFGEEALYKKIELANKLEQKKTLHELCQEFAEKYPKSKYIKELYNDGEGKCDDLPKLSSSESSSTDVMIDGETRRITFKGIYEPIFDDYGAEVYFSGKNSAGEDIGQRGIRLTKGEKLQLADNDFVELVKVEEDSITVKFSVKETATQLAKSTFRFSGVDTTIKLNDYVTHVGENDYKFGVTDISLKKLAKVSVIPNIDDAGTEANFSFRIGIEKRAIQLSPEKTKEKIKSLNKTIEEWEEKSEQLGNVVQGLKASCLGVGAMLVVKNFFANTGGKAIARQNVMRGEGGWYDKCADAANGKGELGDKGYDSIEQCLYKEGDNIEKDVDAYYAELKKQNKEIKELQEKYETKKFLTETHVDTDEFAKEYVPIVQKELKETLDITRKIDVGKGEMVEVSTVLGMMNANTTSASQAKEMQLETRLGKNIDDTLKEIYTTNKNEVAVQGFAEGFNLNSGNVNFVILKEAKELPYKETIYRDIKNEVTIIEDLEGESIEIQDTAPVAVILTSDGKKYIAVLEENQGQYAVKELHDPLTGLKVEDEELTKSIYFEKQDTEAYTNPYESPELSYYETEPYKGLPAVVPFDLDKGWYAYVSQTLPIGGSITSYESSGRVSSLYVCNVWKNGKEESRGGDDKCTMINLGTGQPYGQIGGTESEAEALKLVTCAVEAVSQASSAHKSGVKEVRINTKCDSFDVKVGKPAVNIPDMQCQDFMSPKDCQLLFNVCDPVICPSSRCDFGGKYPVNDVIQSGIIGSIVLCLPNIKEGIFIPVCLTGIKAGIDGLISVFTSYRDCLQESLDTGKMVGVCDEIYSIYLCDFFWRQSLPLANLVIPKAIEAVLGQNVRGGGEYLGVESAWENAGKSLDYFTQYYASESYAAFKSRIAEEVSDAVCDVFVSGSYPEGGNLLDSLTEPDSPPQWYGRFDEIEFTTATVPPISHYKVYYHIYAGEESRAYYKVYLRSPAGTSFYQDTATERFIDSGYIPAGDSVDENPDFTAPSGYKELCIVVNGQEECGFEEVSTSFALDYIKDQYIKEQAEENDIKTETECVAGTISAYSLLNLNLEEAADELIGSSIYNLGIIRICATESPGKGTDALDGGNGSRWIDVGYCGDENLRCWLDTESVENAVEFASTAEEILENQNKNMLDMLRQEGNYHTDPDGEIENLKAMGNEEKIKTITEEFLKKFLLNNNKARALLLRADAYAELAKEIYNKRIANKITTTAESGTKTSDEAKKETGGGTEEDRKDVSYDFKDRTQTDMIIIINYAAENKINNRKCNCGSDCTSYANLLIEAAEKYNIPDPLLLLSIMMQESNCEYDAKSGGSVGLMQISSWEDCESELGLKSIADISGKGNIANNINCGAIILKKKYNSYSGGFTFKKAEEGKTTSCSRAKDTTYYGWEAALRGYVGWGCASGHDDYVEEVMKLWEELKNKSEIQGAITDSNQNLEKS